MRWLSWVAVFFWTPLGKARQRADHWIDLHFTTTRGGCCVESKNGHHFALSFFALARTQSRWLHLTNGDLSNFLSRERAHCKIHAEKNGSQFGGKTAPNYANGCPRNGRNGELISVYGSDTRDEPIMHDTRTDKYFVRSGFSTSSRRT